MRRSRRSVSSEQGDSLELLLDTICNMFGTIIFVALIAALLALSSTAGRTETSLASIDVERDRQIESLQSRAAELEQELARLPAAAAMEIDPEAFERVEAALGEIDRREELIERYSDAVAAVTGNLNDIGAQVAPLREEIERLKAALETARKSKDRTMRTPLERELDRRTFTIVIWNDRIYPVCDWSNGTPDSCARFEQWDDRYVFAASCRLDGQCRGLNASGFARTIPLRPDAGIPIGDAASLLRDPAFLQVLGTLDPDEDLVLLDVAPDSFDSFSAVKEAVLGAGFNYTLSACHAALPIYKDFWVPGTPRGL
jgi:Skp family chaperone for outer membrane proteins